MFQFPTANHALLEPGGEERFFVGTTGKPYTTGMFGCVRSDGQQIHEGLDIRCLQRDKRGEPADPVMATADGTVAYINDRPSLSNYGDYIVVRHLIEGMEIYSLYAHLQSIATGLRAGQAVKAGQTIAIMGRTSNTRETITKDRAHVHFELNLFVNERFSEWYRKTYPGERNDHGIWNGQNLDGIDPRLIFLEEHQQGAQLQPGPVHPFGNGAVPGVRAQHKLSLADAIPSAGPAQPGGGKGRGGGIRGGVRFQRRGHPAHPAGGF